MFGVKKVVKRDLVIYMGIIIGFLKVLKLPIKLLKGWIRKRRKRSELERKCWKHVRLNAPSNVSWQKNTGKDKRKKKRRFSKKTNNFSPNRNY